MISLRRLPLCAVVCLLLSSTALFAQHAAPAVRITAPIDASQLVTLKGSVHPLANAQNDRGAASPSMQLERLHLILKRSPAQDAALRELVQEQNTPGSPNYHKWLTPAQFGAQFGPSDQDLATIQNWLADQGFTVNKVEPGRQTLDISGTVAQLGAAFHTQIHKYVVNGRLHYANANNPAIPAALAPVIGGFVSLNNFPYHSYAQQLGHATYDPSTGRAKPSWTIGGGTAANDNFVLSPADFAVQYDLPSTVKGDGQTIAIVNEANINIDLVNQFRTLFGLPANPPQVIIDGNDPGVDGINNPDGPNYASVEAYLDVEWAGAVAPNATVDLVIAADTSLESGLALAAEHAVYSNIAPVISVSFGLCELYQGSSNSFWYNLWQQAAAQGQTVIVSTGDNGSAGCDNGSEYASAGAAVSGLASTPYNVAVGGTDFYYSSWNQGSGAIDNQLATYWDTAASNTTPKASIKGYIPEQPWNSSQYGLDLFNQYALDGSTTIAAGSGGASSAALCSTNAYSSSGLCTGTTSGYPKPAWQTGTGVPSDNVRDLPDVSLFAANGYNDSYYPICATDGDCQPVSSGTVQIYGVGGTSASAPAFAGIMALVNQKYGRQGQADAVLYPLKAQFPAAFHDVTNGNNSVPCAFSATAGQNSPNCIQIAGTQYVSVLDSNHNNVLEGQIGTGTTVEYKAGAGYDLATGLGSVDATTLINDWGSVQLPSATVTFNATPTSITHGQSVTVSGAVTGLGTPTGNVSILSDSTEPSQQGQQFFALDSSGKYSGSITTLPGGSYNLWASYGGDTKNGLSTSAKIPVTVNPEASGIAFGVFENGLNQYVTTNQTTSIDYGAQLMLSARVAPSADVATLQTCTTSSTTKCPSYTSPTGTVAFKDNSSTINTAVINSEGDAEYNAPFSVGSHSVSASYSGDSSYNASTSTPSAITFTVAKDTPSVLVAASNQVSSNSGFEVIGGPNQPTVLTIILENSAQYSANSNSSYNGKFPVPVQPPTGTITVTGFPSGVPTTAQLSPGVDPYDGAQAAIGTITVPASTAANTYTVKISYSGDGNYTTNIDCGSGAAASCSGSVQIVNSSGITTQTTATMSGSISPNSTITIRGTVKAQSGSAAPTGQVYLFSSGNYITYANLASPSGTTSNFSFTVASDTLMQGTNIVTLQYAGTNTSPYFLPSAYTLSTAIANPLSDFTMVPQSTIVPLTAGDSNGGKVVLNLGSTNGFSGNVNLTCATPSGLNFTCGLSPAAVSLTSGSSSSSTLTITAPANTSRGNYNVSVTGKDAATGEYIHTLAITADVTGSTASSFALTNNGPVTVAAGIDGAAIITATPEGGFTGSVALTCAVTSAPTGAISTPTCTVTTPVNIAGTSAVTGTLTIHTTSTTTGGSYTFTVTGTSGSISTTTPVSVSVVVPGLNLTNSGNITLATPGASGNSTITATPSNGFTGTVNLSCSTTSAPSGATSPVSCSIPATVSITDTTAKTAQLTVSSQSATTLGTYKVTVTATAGSITTTTDVSVTVGTPDFAVTNGGNITVKAGATTGNTSAINITPSGGFTGTVSLACAFVTNASTDPATCSVTPSVNVTGASAVQANLTITTTAASTAMNNQKPILWPTAGGGLALAFALFFWIPKKRRSWLAMFVLLVFLGSIAGMACGGGGGGSTGGGGGGGGNPGTTAGTYSVKVTATSGSLNHTTTVSVSVQ